MNIARLIESAERALEKELEIPEKIERIESYFDAFEGFFPHLAESGLEKKQLEALLEKHQAILKATISLRDDTSRELRALKKRGKGIMAYTDLYPKRMSIITNKRG